MYAEATLHASVVVPFWSCAQANVQRSAENYVPRRLHQRFFPAVQGSSLSVFSVSVSPAPFPMGVMNLSTARCDVATYFRLHAAGESYRLPRQTSAGQPPPAAKLFVSELADGLDFTYISLQ